MDKLFFIVFKNNKLSNLIFSKVHHIHRDILLLKEDNIFKWNQLLNNLYLLSYHNYLSEIKQQQYYLGSNLECIDIVIEYICRGNSVDVLQYFINKEPELFKFKYRGNDLLFYSVKYNSLKIYQYLESLSNSNNNDDDDNNINNRNKKRKTSTSSSPSSSLSKTNEIEWDYYHSISIVPSTGNIDLFLNLLDKVDIRGTLINKIDHKNEYSNIIETIESSAEYGRSEMLDHIFNFFKFDKYFLEDILKGHISSIIKRIIRKCGQLYILKQYFNNIIIQDKLKDIDLISECAKYNRFEMLVYFHENKLGSKDCNNSIDNASLNGNLETNKSLFDNRNEGGTTDAIDKAAENGHFEIIKWLHHNRTEGCTTDAMDKAAEKGHFTIIKWLHHNRTEGCTACAMDYASQKGHLEIIQWLHHNRTEGCTKNAMTKAAEKGHLEIIKWLHHNRTEGCTTDAIDKAAENGHLETIKWLHENRTEGCTIYAMDNAALNGHLEIIKWLHENRTEGCTTNAMDSASCYGYLEIIKWLHHNRKEGCTTNAMDYAASNGHLEIVKWLDNHRSIGCTTWAMDNAAVKGHLDIVKWLHFNRSEGCTTKAMDLAAKNGNLEMIKWLHHNRSEGCTAKAIDIAQKAGHLEIAKWLDFNRSGYMNYKIIDQLKLEADDLYKNGKSSYRFQQYQEAYRILGLAKNRYKLLEREFNEIDKKLHKIAEMRQTIVMNNRNYYCMN